jgi:hypothetical protein
VKVAFVVIDHLPSALVAVESLLLAFCSILNVLQFGLIGFAVAIRGCMKNRINTCWSRKWISSCLFAIPLLRLARNASVTDSDAEFFRNLIQAKYGTK